MFTVENILLATKSTHNQVWKNSKNVSFRYTSVKEWKDTDGKKIKTVKGKATDRAGGSGKPHYFEIDFYGKNDKSPVWLTCSCEYFLFHCEVALMQRGSTDQMWSNGADPNVTNPGKAPRACKHLVAALRAKAWKAEVTHKTKKTRQR